MLKGLGVESIDTVPEWAKPVLQFVVRNEGLSIIKYCTVYLEIFTFCFVMCFRVTCVVISVRRGCRRLCSCIRIRRDISYNNL